MLSPKYLKYLHEYFCVPSHFHSVPWSIKRDKRNGVIQLEIRQDLKGTLFWIVNMLCQLETVSFSISRVIFQVWNGHYTTIDSFLMHGFNIIGWGTPVYYSAYIIFHKQEITCFFNQTLNLDKRLRNKYFDNRHRLNILEEGFVIILPCCYLQGICFAIFSLARPDLAFFHYSFFKEIGWPIWAQIPIKLYECFMLINCWHVIAFIWLCFLTPGYSISGWTHELKQRDLKGCKHSAQDSIRKPYNSIRLYTQLQLLSDQMLDIVKNYIVGTSFFIGGIVVVFMGYASVREIGETPFPQYLAYPTSWIFCVLIFAFTGSEMERWNGSSMSFIKDIRAYPNKFFRIQSAALRTMALKIFDVHEVTRGFTVNNLNDAWNCVIDLLVSS